MLMSRASDVVKVFAHFCTVYYNRYVLVMLPNARETRGGIYGLRIHEQNATVQNETANYSLLTIVQSKNEGEN